MTSVASERDERCVRSTEDTPEGDLHVVCRHVPRASLTTGFIFCVANLISEQLRPRRALDRGQVRVIVAHARRRGVVARVLCTHTASQHRAAAWRHSSPHLLALLATSSCIVWVSACCLGHRAPVMLLSCRSCSLTYAIALTLFIRCAGRSFIPRRITEGELPSGFAMCWCCVPAASASLRLAPACITTSVSLAGLSYTRSARQASREVTRLGFS